MKNLAYFSPSLEVEKTQKLPQNASFCHFDPLFGLCFAHPVPLVRLPPAFASQYALSNTSCWQGCQVGYPITHRYPPLQRRLRSVFWGGEVHYWKSRGDYFLIGGLFVEFLLKNSVEKTTSCRRVQKWVQTAWFLAMMKLSQKCQMSPVNKNQKTWPIQGHFHSFWWGIYRGAILLDYPENFEGGS